MLANITCYIILLRPQLNDTLAKYCFLIYFFVSNFLNHQGYSMSNSPALVAFFFPCPNQLSNVKPPEINNIKRIREIGVLSDLFLLLLSL